MTNLILRDHPTFSKVCSYTFSKVWIGKLKLPADLLKNFGKGLERGLEKGVFIFNLLLFIVYRTSAQDPTPNAGFENWTLKTIPTQYEVPDDWDQLNDETNFIGILTCVKTTDAHSGSFAAKLITKTVTILGNTDTANGVLSTGHLITVPPYGVNGGIPYNERPDSIYGWFKYEPTPGDSCQIQFDLFDVNNDTIGRALFKTAQTVTTYTRFSAPIVYFSSGTPDTSRWLISASNGFNSLPNSTLYIDDVGLVSSVGVEELSLNDFISLQPNPASEVIEIKNDQGLEGELTIRDATGKEMRRVYISGDEQQIHVSDLQAGIYFVQLTDAKHEISASGKIVIQR